MTNKELSRRLRTALKDSEIPVRQGHLELTKQLAKRELSRGTSRNRIGFTRFLIMQIRFVGWKIWALQGATLVAISCFLAASMGEYFMENPRYAALLLCCLSVLVLMTALPFIHRSIQYKMNEIEAATHFSSIKLLMAKLIIVGVGDVLMLICILCFAVLKTPLSADGAMLYLLFPFLLSCCGLLFILGHISAARFVVGGIGLCFFMFTAFPLLAAVLPDFYQQSFSISWAAVCLILTFVCVIQFRRIINRCSYAEMQIV